MFSLSVEYSGFRKHSLNKLISTTVWNFSYKTNSMVTVGAYLTIIEYKKSLSGVSVSI